MFSVKNKANHKIVAEASNPLNSFQIQEALAHADVDDDLSEWPKGHFPQGSAVAKYQRSLSKDPRLHWPRKQPKKSGLNMLHKFENPPEQENSSQMQILPEECPEQDFSDIQRPVAPEQELLRHLSSVSAHPTSTQISELSTPLDIFLKRAENLLSKVNAAIPSPDSSAPDARSPNAKFSSIVNELSSPVGLPIKDGMKWQDADFGYQDCDTNQIDWLLQGLPEAYDSDVHVDDEAVDRFIKAGESVPFELTAFLHRVTRMQCLRLDVNRLAIDGVAFGVRRRGTQLRIFIPPRILPVGLPSVNGGVHVIHLVELEESQNSGVASVRRLSLKHSQAQRDYFSGQIVFTNKELRCRVVLRDEIVEAWSHRVTNSDPRGLGNSHNGCTGEGGGFDDDDAFVRVELWSTVERPPPRSGFSTALADEKQRRLALSRPAPQPSMFGRAWFPLWALLRGGDDGGGGGLDAVLESEMAFDEAAAVGVRRHQASMPFARHTSRPKPTSTLTGPGDDAEQQGSSMGRLTMRMTLLPDENAALPPRMSTSAYSSPNREGEAEAGPRRDGASGEHSSLSSSAGAGVRAGGGGFVPNVVQNAMQFVPREPASSSAQQLNHMARDNTKEPFFALAVHGAICSSSARASGVSRCATETSIMVGFKISKRESASVVGPSTAWPDAGLLFVPIAASSVNQIEVVTTGSPWVPPLLEVWRVERGQGIGSKHGPEVSDSVARHRFADDGSDQHDVRKVLIGLVKIPADVHFGSVLSLPVACSFGDDDDDTGSKVMLDFHPMLVVSLHMSRDRDAATTASLDALAGFRTQHSALSRVQPLVRLPIASSPSNEEKASEASEASKEATSNGSRPPGLGLGLGHGLANVQNELQSVGGRGEAMSTTSTVRAPVTGPALAERTPNHPSWSPPGVGECSETVASGGMFNAVSNEGLHGSGDDDGCRLSIDSAVSGDDSVDANPLPAPTPSPQPLPNAARNLLSRSPDNTRAHDDNVRVGDDKQDLHSTRSDVIAKATAGGIDVHVLDVSIEGTVPWTALPGAAAAAIDSASDTALGCFVCYFLPFSDDEGKCSRVHGSQGQRQGTGGSLWWDSECPVLNGRARHKFSAKQGVSLVECAPKGTEDVIEVRLCFCDSDGALPSAASDRTQFAWGEIPLSEVQEILASPGGIRTIPVLLSISTTEWGDRGGCDGIAPSGEFMNGSVMNFTISNRIEPLLVRSPRLTDAASPGAAGRAEDVARPIQSQAPYPAVQHLHQATAVDDLSFFSLLPAIRQMLAATPGPKLLEAVQSETVVPFSPFDDDEMKMMSGDFRAHGMESDGGGSCDEDRRAERQQEGFGPALQVTVESAKHLPFGPNDGANRAVMCTGALQAARREGSGSSVIALPFSTRTVAASRDVAWDEVHAMPLSMAFQPLSPSAGGDCHISVPFSKAVREHNLVLSAFVCVGVGRGRIHSPHDDEQILPQSVEARARTGGDEENDSGRAELCSNGKSLELFTTKQEKFLGSALIDLTLLSLGVPEVDGWYHLFDRYQKSVGQIKVKVSIQADNVNSPARELLPFSQMKESYSGDDDDAHEDFDEFSPPTTLTALNDMLTMGIPGDHRRHPDATARADDNDTSNDNRGHYDDRTHADDQSHTDDRGQYDDRVHSDRGHDGDRGRTDDRGHDDDRGHTDDRGHYDDRGHSDDGGHDGDRESEGIYREDDVTGFGAENESDLDASESSVVGSERVGKVDVSASDDRDDRKHFTERKYSDEGVLTGSERSYSDGDSGDGLFPQHKNNAEDGSEGLSFESDGDGGQIGPLNDTSALDGPAAAESYFGDNPLTKRTPVFDDEDGHEQPAVWGPKADVDDTIPDPLVDRQNSLYSADLFLVDPLHRPHGDPLRRSHGDRTRLGFGSNSNYSCDDQIEVEEQLVDDARSNSYEPFDGHDRRGSTSSMERDFDESNDHDNPPTWPNDDSFEHGEHFTEHSEVSNLQHNDIAALESLSGHPARDFVNGVDIHGRLESSDVSDAEDGIFSGIEDADSLSHRADCGVNPVLVNIHSSPHLERDGEDVPDCVVDELSTDDNGEAASLFDGQFYTSETDDPEQSVTEGRRRSGVEPRSPQRPSECSSIIDSDIDEEFPQRSVGEQERDIDAHRSESTAGSSDASFMTSNGGRNVSPQGEGEGGDGDGDQALHPLVVECQEEQRDHVPSMSDDHDSQGDGNRRELVRDVMCDDEITRAGQSGHHERADLGRFIDVDDGTHDDTKDDYQNESFSPTDVTKIAIVADEDMDKDSNFGRNRSIGARPAPTFMNQGYSGQSQIAMEKIASKFASIAATSTLRHPGLSGHQRLFLETETDRISKIMMNKIHMPKK